MTDKRHLYLAYLGCAALFAAAALIWPDTAFAQSSAAAGRVQSRLLIVGSDVGTVMRNVIWGGAVIAAIVAIGAMVMGKIDVKKFITIGVACILLGVVGGIVTIFTGDSASVENFDDGGSLGDNFGG